MVGYDPKVKVVDGQDVCLGNQSLSPVEDLELNLVLFKKVTIIFTRFNKCFSCLTSTTPR